MCDIKEEIRPENEAITLDRSNNANMKSCAAVAKGIIKIKVQTLYLCNLASKSVPVQALGCVRDTPDKRDRYVNKTVDTRTRQRSMGIHGPRSVDLSSFVPQVYDQGNIQSCTSNAICSAFEFEKKRHGTNFNPSRLFLYYNVREKNSKASENAETSFRDNFKALKEHGICSEELWPYKDDDIRYKEKPLPTCYEKARGVFDGFVYERLDQNLDEMTAWLYTRRAPFVFGFEVYQSFFDKSKWDGCIMPLPSREEENKRSHAVMAVGFDDRTKLMKVLNSWGNRWCCNGYFLMPYSFITNPDYCFDFWTLCPARNYY